MALTFLFAFFDAKNNLNTPYFLEIKERISPDLMLL